VLGIGEPARVGMQVQHGVPELRVVAVHLLDYLLRAADQRRTAGDEVLEVGERRLQPHPELKRPLRLMHRPVRG
jgi:hypothetical protein